MNWTPLRLFMTLCRSLILLNSLTCSHYYQFVSPLRYAHIYSEKLVHLPHCYFVNDYKQVSFFYTIMTKKPLVIMCFISFLFCPISVTVKYHLQKNLDVLDPKCQPKRSDYGLPEDKFIFACFNQLYKMDPEIFNAW